MVLWNVKTNIKFLEKVFFFKLYLPYWFSIFTQIKRLVVFKTAYTQYILWFPCIFPFYYMMNSKTLHLNHILYLKYCSSLLSLSTMKTLGDAPNMWHISPQSPLLRTSINTTLVMSSNQLRSVYTRTPQDSYTQYLLLNNLFMNKGKYA